MAKPKSKKPQSNTRAVRFTAIQDRIAQCQLDLEELHSELEQWKDAMPDNLQDGTKAQEVEQAMDDLQAVIDLLGDACNASVEFPGMR